MDASSVTKGLIFGGISSCVAECITLPIDIVKTRMQLRSKIIQREVALQYSNSLRAGLTIVRTEGIPALWKGLSPALLRQSTYGSMRYGFYTPIKRLLGAEDAKHTPLWKKVTAGSVAGALSSFVANPTDLVKVRMQADGMAGTTQRSYGGLFNSFSRIIKEEGFLSLWRGVGATCGRATSLSAVELASYDEIKSRFLMAGYLSEGFQLHVASALCAGFLASFASSPFDVMKSRVMQQPTGPDGRGLYYKGMVDCFYKSLKSEGIIALWKGFWPNYARLGPRIVIVFVVMEKLKKWFN